MTSKFFDDFDFALFTPFVIYVQISEEVTEYQIWTHNDVCAIANHQIWIFCSCLEAILPNLIPTKISGYTVYIYACKFVLVSTNLVKIYSCILFVLLTWLNCNWNAVRSTIIRHLQCCSIIRTIQQGECHNSLSWAKHHGTLLQYTAIRGWHIQLVGQCGYMLYIRNSNQNWNVWAAFPIIYKILQHILRDHGYIYRNKNMLM